MPMIQTIFRAGVLYLVARPIPVPHVSRNIKLQTQVIEIAVVIVAALSV